MSGKRLESYGSAPHATITRTLIPYGSTVRAAAHLLTPTHDPPPPIRNPYRSGYGVHVLEYDAVRFVIYDDESLEPITVVNLRGFTERDIGRNGRIWRVPVPEPLDFTVPIEDVPAMLKMRIVDLEFEHFQRQKRDGTWQKSWMCFTKAADLAMLLNPDWLPGQRPAVEYLQSQNDSLTRMLIGALSA